MNFAKFIKTSENYTSCLISGKIFSDNDYLNNNVVQLKCGHVFCYENIVESYKITNNKGRNYISKQSCPYCLQNLQKTDF